MWFEYVVSPTYLTFKRSLLLTSSTNARKLFPKSKLSSISLAEPALSPWLLLTRPRHPVFLIFDAWKPKTSNGPYVDRKHFSILEQTKLSNQYLAELKAKQEKIFELTVTTEQGM